MTTAQESSQSIGPMSPDSETSVGSQVSRQLILLPEDSLASLTVSPGSEEAQRTTATSGLNLSALLEKSNQDTSLLRTFLESSPPISTRCYLTWRVKATPARRSIFQLSPSMPRTDENGFSLLPTPAAVSYGTNQGGGAGRVGPIRPSLETMARKDLWPTPSATDHKGSGKTGELRDRLDYAAERGATKNKLYSTPKSSPSGPDYARQNREGSGGDELATQIGGQLNPQFVSWLMGFPMDWCDMEDEQQEESPTA